MRRRLLVFSLFVVVPLASTAIPSAALAAPGVMGISASSTTTLDVPTLTATPNINQVSYGNQAVTFTGNLTAKHGGGPSYTVSGVTVYYTPAKGSPVAVGVTDTSGNYSGTVQNVIPGTFYLTTNATTTVAAAKSPAVVITGIYQVLNLNNLTVKPATPKYDQTATLTGTVDWAYGTTGVPGAIVQVIDGSVKLPKTTTDSAGNFSVKFNTVNGENLQVNASDSDPLLTPASVGVSYQVPYPLKSKLFKAKLEGNGYVLSSICLLTSPTNFSQLQVNSVELQYAPTPRGPWRKLGMIPQVESFTAPKSCQSQWSYFNDVEVPFAGRLINAYYRVFIPANGVIETFRSPIVHSYLLRSRVTSFNIHPRTVYQGGRISITGHLERQQGKTWRTYAHERIVILAKLKGRKAWSAVTRARTNARGNFLVKLTASSGKGRLVFAALFPGNSRYLWSLSRQITVGFNEPAAAALPASSGLPNLLILPRRTAAVLPGLWSFLQG